MAILGFGLRSYKESLFVAANIYLTLGVALDLFNQPEIAADFAEKSSYLFDKRIYLNAVFEDFVVIYLEIDFEELLPYIQYSAALYRQPSPSASSVPYISPLDLASVHKGKVKPLKTSSKQIKSVRENPEVTGLIFSLRQLAHVHESDVFVERPYLLEFSN